MFNRVLTGSALALLPVLSFAQATFDTTGAVADITSGGTGVAAIGAGFLGLVIIAKVWAMMRR